MRINKYLAECGVASRRKSEELIKDGRVKLNGRRVVELATEIKDGDIVTVDGKKVQPSSFVYLMLNKPKGCVCTTSDEHGRKTVLDLLPPQYADKRIFPVGRLDYDTEGLLILTNDGDLANRLTHPRNDIEKSYIANVEGKVTEDELNKLRAGIVLDGVKTKKCRITVLQEEEKLTRAEVVISEGRNRQVRRMFESINRTVAFLKRVAIGDLRLGGLYRGKVRELSDKEIKYLKNL